MKLNELLIEATEASSFFANMQSPFTGIIKIPKDFSSLLGCPAKVIGDFDCLNTMLTSFEHGPKEVIGDFKSYNNEHLTSLQGSPARVDGDFNCSHNPKLTSLAGCPSVINKTFFCMQNPKITSLKGIHHHLKSCTQIDFIGCPITSHVLGLFKIEGLTQVWFDDTLIQDHHLLEEIINEHLQGSVNGSNMGACQDELEAKRLEDYAQL